jgi:argininosuccinate lyase
MTNETTPMTDEQIEEYASKVFADIAEDGVISDEMFKQMMEDGDTISDDDQNKIIRALQEKVANANQVESEEETPSEESSSDEGETSTVEA